MFLTTLFLLPIIHVLVNFFANIFIRIEFLMYSFYLFFEGTKAMRLQHPQMGQLAAACPVSIIQVVLPNQNRQTIYRLPVGYVLIEGVG